MINSYVTFGAKRRDLGDISDLEFQKLNWNKLKKSEEK